MPGRTKIIGRAAFAALGMKSCLRTSRNAAVQSAFFRYEETIDAHETRAVLEPGPQESEPDRPGRNR